MKICKRQYRIVTDEHAGYEVQRRVWYFPFWLQIRDGRYHLNTSYTIEDAEVLIKNDKKPRFKSKVVKTCSCS